MVKLYKVLLNIHLLKIFALTSIFIGIYYLFHAGTLLESK